MQHPILMTKTRPLQQLIHEAPHCIRIQRPTVPMLIHILLQVLFTVLEYKNKFGLGVDDIVQANDIDVFEFFHQRNFADGCGWCSFFCIEVDFFQGYYFVGGSGSSLEGYFEYKAG